MGQINWARKQSNIQWTGSHGQIIKGIFNATAAKSGLPVRVDRTWIERGNCDDGGKALAINQAYLFGSRRMLLTYAQVGNISVFGGCDRLSVAADESGITAEIAAHWAMLEIKSGGITPANGVGCAAVRGDLNVASGSTVSANSVVSAFCAAAEKLSATTHTGRYTVLHVPNPQAGTYDNLIDIGDATGCSAAGGTKTSHATVSKWLNISIGGVAHYIPAYDAKAD